MPESSDPSDCPIDTRADCCHLRNDNDDERQMTRRARPRGWLPAQSMLCKMILTIALIIYRCCNFESNVAAVATVKPTSPANSMFKYQIDFHNEPQSHVASFEALDSKQASQDNHEAIASRIKPTDEEQSQVPSEDEEEEEANRQQEAIKLQQQQLQIPAASPTFEAAFQGMCSDLIRCKFHA